MALLNTEDISSTALVTVLACYQLASFARAVGAARRKHSVTPPAVEGDPEFVRTFRAQQNSVEFFGCFIGVLWASSIFFHQYPSAVFGLIYVYGRNKYFYGYAESAKKRLKGFQLCVLALQALLGMSALGLGQTLLRQHLGLNVAGFVAKLIGL